MLDLDTECRVLYEAVVSCDHSRYISVDQVGGLIGLVKQGLVDKSRTNRIAVMRFLIGDAIERVHGVSFESFKNMDSGIASMLISLWKEPNDTWTLNAYGRELLGAAEIAAQTGTHSVSSAHL